MNISKNNMAGVNRFLVFIQEKLSDVLPIAIACFISVMIFQNQQKKIEELTAIKTSEEKKNAVIEEIISSEKKLNAMKKVINKKDIASAFNTFSELATRSNVVLVAVKPLNEKKQGVFTSYSFDLTVKAGSFHDLGVFLAKLENSQDIYFLNKFLIKYSETDKEKIFDMGLSLDTILVNG